MTLITTLLNSSQSKSLENKLYGVRNLVVHFSSWKRGIRNVLKMSSANDVSCLLFFFINVVVCREFINFFIQR